MICLVRLSAVTAELLEHPVTFYVQDALSPLFIDPVDITISDLPVGFYPDDDNAFNYEMMPAEGHAYAHHLFIEQSMNHTKPVDTAYLSFQRICLNLNKRLNCIHI